MVYKLNFYKLDVPEVGSSQLFRITKKSHDFICFSKACACIWRGHVCVFYAKDYPFLRCILYKYQEFYILSFQMACFITEAKITLMVLHF